MYNNTYIIYLWKKEFRTSLGKTNKEGKSFFLLHFDTALELQLSSS